MAVKLIILFAIFGNLAKCERQAYWFTDNKLLLDELYVTNEKAAKRERSDNIVRECVLFERTLARRIRLNLYHTMVRRFYSKHAKGLILEDIQFGSPKYYGKHTI